MKRTFLHTGFMIFMMLSFAVAGLAQQSANDYAVLGDQQFRRKDFDNAISSQTECIRLYPREKECRITRGLAHKELKNYDLAIVDFTMAIRTDLRDPFAYQMRGISYYQLKKFGRAIADFETALQLNPSDKNTKELLESARSAQNTTEELKVIDSLLRKLESGAPKSAADHFNLGKDQQAAGKYDEAIISFTECIRLLPNADNCYCHRGNSYFAEKNFDAALADYNEAIRISPQIALFHNNRGLANAFKGNYEGAKKDYDEAIRLNPQYGDAYNNRAHSFFAVKDFNAALQNLNAALNDANKAVSLNPQNWYYLNMRGLIYKKLNNQSAAIADFTAVIKLSPNNTEAYFERGKAHYENEDLNLAIADLNQAIKLDPGKAEYYLSRALAYMETADGAKPALADLKKALELKSNYEEAKNLMELLEKKND